MPAASGSDTQLDGRRSQQAHCPSCHVTFSTVEGFDLHRQGSHFAGTRTCLDPATARSSTGRRLLFKATETVCGPALYPDAPTPARLPEQLLGTRPTTRIKLSADAEIEVCESGRFETLFESGVPGPHPPAGAGEISWKPARANSRPCDACGDEWRWTPPFAVAAAEQRTEAGALRWEALTLQEQAAGKRGLRRIRSSR